MITNHEWLTRNSLRSYPVREDSNSVSDRGWKLPDSLVADIMISGDHQAERVCIQSVTIGSRLVSVVIGDPDSGDSLAVATAMRGAPVDVALTPIAAGVGGFISFGDALLSGGLDTAPTGIHHFASRAIIESRCSLLSGPMPVTGMVIDGVPLPVRGNVPVSKNQAVKFTVQEVEVDGEIVTQVTIGLTSPSDFLSPCEEKTTTCGCRSVPVATINGVSPDENGVIYLELQDENGSITQLGSSTLALLIAMTRDTICSKQEEPDEYGRIKGGGQEYSNDSTPLTEYKSDEDTTFPSPLL